MFALTKEKQSIETLKNDAKYCVSVYGVTYDQFINKRDELGLDSSLIDFVILDVPGIEETYSLHPGFVDPNGCDEIFQTVIFLLHLCLRQWLIHLYLLFQHHVDLYTLYLTLLADKLTISNIK